MKSALRFDHREIAVIFSLFVFVSLLMFTVGILVGKGLTQAKYEGHAPIVPKQVESLAKTYPGNSGSSVSLGSAHSEPIATARAHAPLATTEKTPVPAAETVDTRPRADAVPLKLVPLRPSQAQNVGTSLADPSETDSLLKNPRILSLVEPDEQAARVASTDPVKPKRVSPGDAAKRERSVSSIAEPESFTVQVGSYPNETAAQERVEALKKMGFPQASFSANNLGAANGTWYRVWLGQYPDYSTAKKTGDQLQARGEVKNYIVRKN